MEPEAGDKVRKRSSEESLQSPAKAAKVDEEEEKLTTPKTKQLTLAASLQKIGSPCEIIKTCSPGAKRSPSLLEILSGEVQKEKEARPKDSVVVGVDSESFQDPTEIKNGSRDRWGGEVLCVASHR